MHEIDVIALLFLIGFFRITFEPVFIGYLLIYMIHFVILYA